MATSNVHICIVSDQVLANLIPALMERPERVYLAASTGMTEKGKTELLRRILEERGIKVAVQQGLPDMNLAAMRNFAQDLLDRVRREGGNAKVTLNVTGGTKLMTLALFDACSSGVDRIIYTHTDRDLIEELPKDLKGGEVTGKIEPVLDVPTYLRAHGFRCLKSRSDGRRWRDRCLVRLDLTEAFVQISLRHERFLGALNYAASNALGGGGNLSRPEQDLSHRLGPQKQVFLAHLVEKGLLYWDGKQSVEFCDVESARYVGGGWLEEYAWLKLASLRPDDVRCGVEGRWERARKVMNEFDVVAVHNNRLLLIECKTLRMDREGMRDTEILYKLDSLAMDLKGLYGSVLLLSARVPTDAMKRRARQQNIALIGPGELVHLDGPLLHWMESGKLSP
jgi:hypothetical protein